MFLVDTQVAFTFCCFSISNYCAIIYTSMMNMTLCNAQNVNKLKIIWINRIWRRQGSRDNFVIDFRLLKSMASLRSKELDGTSQRIVRPSSIKTIIIHAVKIKTQLYQSLISISNDVLTFTYEPNYLFNNLFETNSPFSIIYWTTVVLNV
jgi:hypothetical protein